MTRRQREMMIASTLDDFTQRVKSTRAVTLIIVRRQQLARQLAAVGILSVLIVFIEMELRLSTLHYGYDVPSNELVPLNVLRGFACALTVALVVLLLLSHWNHWALKRSCSAPVGWLAYLELGIELLICCVGIVPPYVETTVPMWLSQDPPLSDLHSRWASHWHLDQLGVLVLLRVPLIIGWLISIRILSSPVYIAWQYNVQVTPMFRIKYLFTQLPWTMIALVAVTALLSGTFGMHVLEYAFEPRLDAWFFATYDVMVGLGWSVTIAATGLGRCISVTCSLLGILCLAVLTATLCGASELDATEVWLIASMQQRQALIVRNQQAIGIITTALRVYQAAARKRRAAPAEARVAELEIRYHRAAMRMQTRQFKTARLNSNGAMNVTNIKTLDGLMRTMQSTQAAMRQEQTDIKAMLTQLAANVDAMACNAKESSDVAQVGIGLDANSPHSTPHI